MLYIILCLIPKVAPLPAIFFYMGMESIPQSCKPKAFILFYMALCLLYERGLKDDDWLLCFFCVSIIPKTEK